MQTDIFLPVLALIAWTMLVLLLVPYQRIKAARAGLLSSHDFRCGESARVPESVSKPNRVFINLLEVPTLFYILCLIAYVTQHVNVAMVYLGWLFVALRLLHSLVYLTYNRVLHRFIAFVLSNFVLMTMFVLLALHFLNPI